MTPPPPTVYMHGGLVSCFRSYLLVQVPQVKIILKAIVKLLMHKLLLMVVMMRGFSHELRVKTPTPPLPLPTTLSLSSHLAHPTAFPLTTTQGSVHAFAFVCLLVYVCVCVCCEEEEKEQKLNAEEEKWK